MRARRRLGQAPARERAERAQEDLTLFWLEHAQDVVPDPIEHLVGLAHVPLALVGYADHAGGLNQVATVLAELAERIDPEELATAARTAPVAWAQRLGYLLEHLGFALKTPALKEYVREHAKQSTALLPKAPHMRARRNKGWKLYVNAHVEAEV